ncbi:MAG: type II toxin-antitoxin system VapC family toxin [Verrucomicrobiales bacterium]|nr:type II toxin-antitoxin system VapC family toxin [Verrucomicrobiales bacterium]
MRTVRTLDLYLDTSVIGGYFDEEFKEATQNLWHERDLGFYRFVTSPLVDQEISGAPENVRDLLSSTFTQNEILPITLEVRELALAYMQQEVVPVRYADDALHVAIATVHQIKLIVSWNFKHMVNYQRESGFNSVNLLQGYPSIRILSPLELIHEDEN